MQSDLTRGRKIPPARADTEGMAGASNASLNTSEYPNPSEVFPKRRTNWYATRFPSPVLMKPRAKKKASAMSHGIGSPKAENAAAKVRVLVSTHAPSPINATAPRGNGCVMIPTIVARKIERSCHAFFDTPSGAGMNQIATPVAMAMTNGLMAAPSHFSGGFSELAVLVTAELAFTVPIP
mgnify:FL=1